MTFGRLRFHSLPILALCLGALAICGEVLWDLGNSGGFDWDYFFFQEVSIYRSVVEFGELPLWNPWYMGGVPIVGNLQAQFPSPWFLLDLAVGPFLAIKLKIVAHYLIGVLGMYWMSRQLGLSRMASVYTAGTFFFSTWLALRVHGGHLTYLSTAYLPYVVGFLVRGRAGATTTSAIGGGAFVALMILQGGVYDVIFASVVIGPLAFLWAIHDHSGRPLRVALLIGMFGVVFGAVKLMPVVAYMRENPRTVGPGGDTWQVYKEVLARPVSGSGGIVGKNDVARPGKASRWDLPRFVMNIFLGRDQRSNVVYYPIQGHGWHEYGAYVGPLAAVLLMFCWLAFRESWPWLVAAAGCFAIAAGNFAWLAPWTLLHRLPILSSMHAPGRFLTPCAFAATMGAGFILDAIRRRVCAWARTEMPGRQWVSWVVGLLVAFSLIDSILVARHSIEGVFSFPPQATEPRQPTIVTVSRSSTRMTPLNLANFCLANGYEPIEPKVRVNAQHAPGYRGEMYFEPAGGSAGGHVELKSWTANTVVLRAYCPVAGQIVLNRNWCPGWLAVPPYRAEELKGLVGARVAAGEHVIRFQYWPPWFGVGAGLTAASMAISCGILVVTRFSVGEH